MASREIPTVVVDSLDDDVFYPFFAVELLFDGDQTLRLWTGTGTLDYQGQDWYGTGSLLQFDSVEETTEIAAKGASLTLSGVPQEVLSLALTQPYQGRKANIYFGNFTTGTSAANLTQIFSGYMDQMNIEEGPDTCTVQLTLENKLVDLERPRVARFTSAYQKTVYSGDLGLDFVEDLQDKEIVWGRKSGN